MTNLSQCNARYFENIHQVGGIQTATLDDPQAGGRPGCRVAMVNTGSPLRFTVALDRGGDIVEAFYGPYSLAYLTANGYKLPSPAYHHELDWLASWPGGLVTTCGPRAIGGPHDMPDGSRSSLHGTYSNTPAKLTGLHNPDPAHNDHTMSLDMCICDTKMFQPTLRINRRLACRLGQAAIDIHDVVTNTGNQSTPHHWLYHVNLGYPLLEAGAQVILGGSLNHYLAFDQSNDSPSSDWLNEIKCIPEPLEEHRGTGERLIVVNPDDDEKGNCRVGLINQSRSLAVELLFSREQLPRLGHWQHFGPAGSYVCGIEPFCGALVPKDHTRGHSPRWTLEPGETREYTIKINVYDQPDAIRAFESADTPIRKDHI